MLIREGKCPVEISPQHPRDVPKVEERLLGTAEEVSPERGEPSAAPPGRPPLAHRCRRLSATTGLIEAGQLLGVSECSMAGVYELYRSAEFSSARWSRAS